MSFEIDVDSMNRMASQVSTSVENTAASASAPSQTGNWVARKVGSTRFGSVMPGVVDLAAMPNSTGRNANSSNTTAFIPTPSLTARSDDAPYAF